MKLKLQILFVLIISLAATTHAQNKPKAILLDIYFDEHRDLEKLGEIATEFAYRLTREPSTTKGYIIDRTDYNKFKLNSDSLELFDRIRDEIGNKYLIPDDRIVYDPSRMRRGKYITIEFWLVSEGAREPNTNAVADFDSNFSTHCICPLISIESYDVVFTSKQPTVFTVKLRSEDQETPTFNWTVSDGTIVSGQETDQVTIDLSQAKSGKVTIKVEIGGLCKNCNIFTEKTIVVN